VHETSSCLITHRPLDLHRYPRPLLIQACFRHQRALQLLHQFSTHSQPPNRAVTPPNASIPTSTPYRTRHLGTTATPLRHMTEILPLSSCPGNKRLLLGRMPPRKFLKRFLATDEVPRVPDSEGAFKSVLSAKKEVDMYAPFVSGLFVSAPTAPYQHLIDNSKRRHSRINGTRGYTC